MARKARKPRLCLECGEILPHGFGTHLLRKHDMSLQEYNAKFFATFCECGCGQPAPPSKQGEQSRYIRGHSNIKFTPEDDYDITEAYLSQPRGKTRTFPDRLLDRHKRQQITYRARKLGLATTADTPIIVRHLSREDAAYIAGLFDGDGNILGDCITFQITEGHEDSLHWCRKIIGTGQVVPVKNKDAWRYQLNGERNISFLAKQIAPYSVIKKDILTIASRHFEESEPYYEQTSLFMPQCVRTRNIRSDT